MHIMKKAILSLSVVAFAVAAMALPKEETVEKRVLTQYHFIGDDLSQVTNSDLWVEGSSPAPGCQEGGLPCYVETDMAIEDWLDGKSAQQVVQQADARRN